MNAGEPPDEAGESDEEERSTDPERDDAVSEEPVTDSPDDAGEGDEDDELDPAREVEAAVEEALGPGVLDDDEDGDGEEDERAEEDADEAREPGQARADDVTEADGPTDDESAADSGDVGATGDRSGGDTAEDVTDESRDSTDDPSTDGEHPTDDRGRVDADESSDGDDPTDDGEIDEQAGGGLDESAAVEAAQELIDGTESGDGPEPKAAEDEHAGDPTEADTPASRPEDEREESAESGNAASDDGTQAVDDIEEPADDVPGDDVPADVQKYDRFKKIDGGTYDRANEFLRDRTYITAREWAMARLCADFRTETGVEMTKIGENLPELVPFMTDTYTPQAVNQARAAFEEKVRKAGATFLYGAMCDFFTAEELDDVMYEATEVAKFLLEVEGVELSVEEELAAEDHISEVMRDVREHSAALRHDEVTCPECGHEINADD